MTRADLYTAYLGDINRLKRRYEENKLPLNKYLDRIERRQRRYETACQRLHQQEAAR